MGSTRRADLIGMTFAHLTVVSLIRSTSSGRLWLCRCDCPAAGVRELFTTNLKAGYNIGCSSCETERRGHAKTHGDSVGYKKTKLYTIWKGICGRCRDLDNKYYGGKGITVCVEWAQYEPFRDWARGAGYKEGLSIDRLDPTVGYRPDNCEWVTRSENSRRMMAYRKQLRMGVS